MGTYYMVDPVAAEDKYNVVHGLIKKMILEQDAIKETFKNAQTNTSLEWFDDVEASWKSTGMNNFEVSMSALKSLMSAINIAVEKAGIASKPE